MRVLLTGGTGFLGSHLLASLRARGDVVECLTRQRMRSDDPGVICRRADLEDAQSLRSLLLRLEPCDAVVHFGARLTATAQEAHGGVLPFLPANVAATSLLLEQAWAWGAKPFLYASGITVVGNPPRGVVTESQAGMPEHPYVFSKYLGELACEHFRVRGMVPATSLRITSPYGPGMRPSSVLPLFFRRACASEPITVQGTGARTQNFVHVSDVIRGTLLALDQQVSGIYNIGGAESVSMLDLARMIVSVLPGSRSVILTGEGADAQEDVRWNVDSSKAARDFGYQPQMSLRDGLANYAAGLNRTVPPWGSPCE